ncbi:S8/S53 family peptidase [Comamonas odontotermitis]|uniref:S8/S53 family peptidase n=1 Tax=Comamonas odontotermitis TaxID=379895 RepID=UPI001CC7CAEB|nr:S8/S53 family peptidase [Comamonas odontotermitis]UBB15268.1 S8/S53 family peptidase [Comamonas odontotermitis]
MNKELILAMIFSCCLESAYAGKYRPENAEPLSIIYAQAPVESKPFNSDSRAPSQTLYRIELNTLYAFDVAKDLNLSDNLYNYEVKNGKEDSGRVNIPQVFQDIIEVALKGSGIFVNAYESLLNPAFSAWLTDAQAEKLRYDEKISEIRQVEGKDRAVFSGKSEFSSLSTKAVPVGWPSTYVNTTTAFSGNRVYIVDGGTSGAHPALTADVNFTEYANPMGNPHYPSIFERYHTPHILSVVGGRGNVVRGINPGQNVKLYNKDFNNIDWDPSTATSTQDKIFWALQLAARNSEDSSEFSSLALSSNQAIFDYQSTVEKNQSALLATNLWGWTLRQASNRFFITNSSGNYDQNACYTAYTYNNQFGNTAQINDGIMVVSGIDATGNVFLSGTNDIPGVPASDSAVSRPTWGECIEVWAPAKDIPGISYSTGAQRLSTGTSYAAPIVAAIASRYGNSSTRPIQREQFIRENMVATGYYDHGFAIKAAKYSSNSSSVPYYLNPLSIYAPGTSANLKSILSNGKFYPPTNGGAWFYSNNSNQVRLIVDMGSNNNIVSGVRITPVTGSNNKTGTLTVTASNDPNSFIGGLAMYEAHVSNLAPIYYSVQNSNARYFQIAFSSDDSNLGISEIEMYGK